MLRLFEAAEYIGTLPGLSLTLVLPQIRELTSEDAADRENWDNSEVVYHPPSRFWNMTSLIEETSPSFQVMGITEYLERKSLSASAAVAADESGAGAAAPLLWVTNVPRRQWTKSKKKHKKHKSKHKSNSRSQL